MPVQIATLLLIVFLSSGCSGPLPQGSGEGTKADVPLPTVAEVAEDASRLPDRFSGSDIKALFTELRRSGRSEFESTAEYQKRLANEATLYSFVVEPLEAKYDADRSEMLVRLRLKVDASTTDTKERSLMVRVVSEVEQTTFPASNALGVSVDVQRTEETSYGLAVAGIPAGTIGKRVPSARYERYERFFDVLVPMSNDEARRRKAGLRFVVRGQPSTQTTGRVFEGSYEWKATVSSPRSRISRSHAVYVDQLAVWLVDLTSGDILKRTSISELLKTSRAD